MILTCPNCDSKFRVNDDAIGPKGRKVKCRNCAHTWHAMPEGAENSAPPPPKAAPKPAPEPAPVIDDDPVPPPPPPAAPPEPEPDPKPMPPPSGMDDSAPPASDPPPIPPGEDFVLRQRQPKVEKKSPVMAWVILVVILVAAAGAGYVFRTSIVAAYPPIAKIYSLVGINPDLVGRGLTIQNEKATVDRAAENKLLFTAEIHTSLSERTDIPIIRGALVDSNEQELFVWFFEADKPDILPGEVVIFETEVENPPSGAVRADFQFHAPGDATIGEDAMIKDAEGETQPMSSGEGEAQQ